MRASFRGRTSCIWSVAAWILDPYAVKAICAEAIVMGAAPHSFEKRTRKRCPPMLGRTIMRMIMPLIGGSAANPGIGFGA